MRTLVLWANDISTNLGVRALAAGTAALVHGAIPEATFTFQSFGQPNRHLPGGRVTSIAKERVTGRLGMQKWLSQFDLVVDTRAGDSFADIYGARRLAVMSAMAECARQAGAVVVMGPQTIGPFTSARGRATGRFSLRRADAVLVRDSNSLDHARKLGHSDATLTTDVVFALPVPAVRKTRDVVLNISGLLWRDNPHVDAVAYRAVVTSLYDRLTSSGRTVALLPHVLDSSDPDNDFPAIREFAAAHAPDAEVLAPTGLDDVRAMVASAELVIGSRMHACLNALSVGTPAIPLAYSRKFKPLLDDLGWRTTVDLRTDPDPAAATDGLASNAELVAAVETTLDRARERLLPATDAIRSAIS
ncbi:MULTISPECIES: polysaccharide pyruvyl transferase family protein [unclassified Leifsonia]|uniref:polysaccharide pyruvyl transferase family protein n=1 Tax=unclassified Leifsonia TaxID=2663824 RepID=UPI000A979321|nr:MULTISPECIES: polysaccharide pyruvyl transferase family protein [unclassified Leifsonia]